MKGNVKAQSDPLHEHFQYLWREIKPEIEGFAYHMTEHNKERLVGACEHAAWLTYLKMRPQRN